MSSASATALRCVQAVLEAWSGTEPCSQPRLSGTRRGKRACGGINKSTSAKKFLAIYRLLPS